MTWFGDFVSGTKDFLGFDGQFGIQGAAVSQASTAPAPSIAATVSNVPIPQRKPVFTPAPTSNGQDTSSFGDFFSGIGNILKTVGDAAETGVSTYYGIKSKIEGLKTAEKLEDIKYAAVTKSAEQAPAAAQIYLPSVSDFLSDPIQAASRVTPAALSGSVGFNTGLSTLTLALGALGIFLVARKA